MTVPLILSIKKRRAKHLQRFSLDAAYTLNEVQDRINRGVEQHAVVALVLGDGTILEFDPKDYVGLAVVENRESEEQDNGDA
jgi:hypothetical protein